MSETINTNLPENNKNSRRAFYVRLTQDEYDKMKTMIKAFGISAPEIFRRALFEAETLTQPMFSKEDTLQMMAELNRQGNNINQIAKKVNSGLADGWSQSFNNLVRAYMDIRHIIGRSYGNR